MLGYVLAYRNNGDVNSYLSICETSIVVSDYASANLNSKCFGVSCFDGNHAEFGNFSFKAIVGPSKIIYFGIQQNKVNNSLVIATHYRRIGTNT